MYNNYLLTIIGLLAPVENLTAHSQWLFILLTWTPPISLDITGVDPDLWYCVEVYNITWGRAPFTTNCSVHEPQFYFTAPNRRPCDLFEFRIFAVNQVGNGTVASVNGTFNKSEYQIYIYNQLMIPGVQYIAIIFQVLICLILHRTSS